MGYEPLIKKDMRAESRWSPMPSRRANRGYVMPDGKRNVTHQKLKTPCAAALAGLLGSDR
jgi:hypothetical protein